MDSGSDTNMLNIDRIPAKYWTVTSTRLHTVGADPLVNFEVPKATVCLNQYSLDVRSLLMKLNQVCILGTPFLKTIEIHGVCTYQGKTCYYMTIDPLDTPVFVTLISTPKILNMVHNISLYREHFSAKESHILNIKEKMKSMRN